MRSSLIVLLLFFLSACSRAAVSEQATASASPSISPTPLSTQSAPLRATTAPEPTLQAGAGNTPAAAELLLTSTAAPLPQTQNMPDPATASWLTVASGLQSPIGMAHAGDGTGRLFVIEQAGRIVVIKDGQVDPQPFLDIRDRVGSKGNEQGLLGLAFHPKFKSNGYFFINYTDLEGNTVIARYQADQDDPQRADPASETRLL